MQIPGANQYPHINTSSMHNRKEIKSENLHRKHQEDLSDYYRVKQQDFELNRTSLKDWETTKSIQEINKYMSLKKSVEYGLYQYSKHLGNHLDVTV
jgi:hypothetical protein